MKATNANARQPRIDYGAAFGRQALLAGAALGLGLAVLPQTALAEGKIIGMWASGTLGGAIGRGDHSSDMYEWASGGAAGAEIGMHILFLGAYFEYVRMFGGDAGANMMSLNFGGDNEFKFGEKFGLVLRLAGSWYFGNMNSETRTRNGREERSSWVDTKGVGGRFGLGFRYHFMKVLSVGMTPQIGYHYFFYGRDETPTLGNSSESHGWDFQALAYLRFGIGI